MRHYLTLATSKCCCDAVMLCGAFIRKKLTSNPILLTLFLKRLTISYISLLFAARKFGVRNHRDRFDSWF